MDRPNSSSRNTQLKVFFGQIILIVTFVLSCLTTLTTIYIILALKLNNNAGVIQIKENSENFSQILLNQNLNTDKFQPLEALHFETIISPSIDISTRNSRKAQEPSASLSMNNDEIIIQASHFSSGSRSMSMDFRLPKKLSSLEVPHGVQNLRQIRPLPNSASHRNHPILEIISGDDLHLSGNVGLRCHSSRARMSSKHSIDLHSRDGSITLSASRIYLPNLAHDPNRKESNYIMDQLDETFSNNRISEKMQLCIGNGNGLIYQAIDSC